MKKIRRFGSSGTILVLILLTFALGVALVQADSPSRVALVVVHGNGDVLEQCVEVSSNSISGYDLLKESGLDLNVEASGMGGTICRIDGEGCSYPEDSCFCECEGNDCTFWSYWQLKDGDWRFSEFGSSNSEVRSGDVEGWVWGSGTTNGGAEPPDVEFDDICQPPPTDTPTATPTATHTPAPTSTPTNVPDNTPTPEATKTPKPDPTPKIHSFSADRTSITAGESVSLQWDLSDADAAYLRYNGQEEGVTAPGSKMVSPNTTTVYTLVARNKGGDSETEITITVDNAPPPAATNTPPPLPTPAPDQPAPQPTNTPPPEPIINFNAASLTVPTGACTSLQWDVRQATTIYLDEQEVGPVGSQQACPTETTGYRLRAIYPGGEQTAELRLQVVQPVAVAETRTDSPPPTIEAEEVVPAAATPVAVAAALIENSSPAIKLNDQLEQPRRFTVSRDEEESGPGNRLFLLGGASIALLLFVGLPVVMLLVGGVAWWVKGRQ